MNIAFVKYKEFKELRDINEAKTKITEAFYLVSTTSLKQKTKQKLQLDLSAKKITISNKSLKTQEIKLPKDLIYFHTYTSNLNNLELSFTQNGNITKSFSIYIFNRTKKVRYKISFYGFDKFNSLFYFLISIVLKKDGINKGINRFSVNHYNSTLSVILLSKKGEI